VKINATLLEELSNLDSQVFPASVANVEQIEAIIMLKRVVTASSSE
jgi:hypothetical protein